MSLREQIRLAARLYKCQDAAKSIYGVNYTDKVSTYKKIIEAWNEKHGTDTLKSVITICQSEAVSGDTMSVMLFMAAAVEIIEG